MLRLAAMRKGEAPDLPSQMSFWHQLVTISLAKAGLAEAARAEAAKVVKRMMMI